MIVILRGEKSISQRRNSSLSNTLSVRFFRVNIHVKYLLFTLKDVIVYSFPCEVICVNFKNSMKNILLIALNFFSFFSLAQSFSPAVQQIIDAENSFASLSKKQNTRDAFIANLADNGIVFEETEPVIGKEVWLKRRADSSLLFWWPVFSDVSASGDFGYNTDLSNGALTGQVLNQLLMVISLRCGRRKQTVNGK